MHWLHSGPDQSANQVLAHKCPNTQVTLLICHPLCAPSPFGAHNNNTLYSTDRWRQLQVSNKQVYTCLSQFTKWKNLQQNTQIKSLQLCLHLYPTHYTNYKKLITLNDRVPCAGAQCCVITTLTTSDTERYTQIQLHKKEFRVPVRNVVHSQHWPPLTRRKCKNFTQYSDSLLLKIFTSEYQL